MSAKDLVSAAIKAEEAIVPPLSMDRVKELNEIRSGLLSAVNDNMKSRGLGIGARADGSVGIES